MTQVDSQVTQTQVVTDEQRRRIAASKMAAIRRRNLSQTSGIRSSGALRCAALRSVALRCVRLQPVFEFAFRFSMACRLTNVKTNIRVNLKDL
jgi:hypothetical protein